MERRFVTLEEFADHFSSVALDGHTWHGNLDGFNDILRGGFGTPEGGFVLRWLHSAVAQGTSDRRLFGGYSTGWVTAIRRIRAEVAAELEAAQAGLGPTVFDWLVEIIAIHGAGGEESEDGVELDLR